MTSNVYTKSSGVAETVGVLWNGIKRIPPVYPVFTIIFLVVMYFKPDLPNLARDFHLPAPGCTAGNFDDR